MNIQKKYTCLIIILCLCLAWILVYACTTFTRSGFYNQNEWTYTITAPPVLEASIDTPIAEIDFSSVVELDFHARLALAAEERCAHNVIYDPAYVVLDYPGGDVAADRGVCSDVVIRSYRTQGLDLQLLIHEDMLKNFSRYPNLWRLSKPDKNIDHRRVPNLMTYFSRYGEVHPKGRDSGLYLPGHIVAWRLPNNRPHIGIVSSQRNTETGNYKMVHNIGSGPRLEDCLFNFDIIGHYSFEGIP